jgi:glycosyltransferase involved in cell wall biosynthesis
MLNVAEHQGEPGDQNPTPLLSVIVPAFNADRFILAALDNIQAQEIASLEIIVVDDGSTDQTASLAEGHPSQPRIKRRENGGPGAARNTGLEVARAPIVTFLDVDDAWPPGSLNLRLNVLTARPDIEMVMGCVQFEGLDGTPIPLKPWAAPNLGAGMYRKTVFEKIGLFEPSLLLDDVDWFWRSRDAGIATAKLEEITLKYRRHGQSLTAAKTWIELGLAKVIRRALQRRRPGQDMSSVSSFINLSQAR